MAEFWSEPLTRDNLPEFFNEFAESAYSYIYSMTGDEAETEKKVEEAFDKVYRQRRHLQPNQLVFSLGAELDKVCGTEEGAAPSFEAATPDVACMARMMNKVLHNADTLAGAWGTAAADAPKPDAAEEPAEETPAEDGGEDLPEEPEPAPENNGKKRKALGIVLIVLLVLIAAALAAAALSGKLPVQQQKTTATTPTATVTEPAKETTAAVTTTTKAIVETVTETPSATPTETETTVTTTVTETTTPAETETETTPAETETEPATEATTTAEELEFDVKPMSATGTVNVGGIDTLTVRRGPAKTYEVVGDLENGSAITIIGKSANWYRVLFDGKTGFVFNKYVKDVKESDTPVVIPTAPADPESPAPADLKQDPLSVYEMALKNGTPLAYDEKTGSYKLAGTVFTWDGETMTEPDTGEEYGLAQLFNTAASAPFPVVYHAATGTVTSTSGKLYGVDGKALMTQPDDDLLPTVTGGWMLTSATKSGTAYFLSYTHYATGRKLTYSTETSAFTDCDSGEPFTMPAKDADIPDDKGRGLIQPRYDSEGKLWWYNTVDRVRFTAGDKAGTWKTADGKAYTVELTGAGS